MTSTRESLLRAVVESPEDDGVRLIFADYLDENGEPERAELIRVGCKLAELEQERINQLNDETDWEQCSPLSAGWCPNCGDCCCKNPEDRKDDADCPLHSPTSPHGCGEENARKILEFRRREQEILTHVAENGKCNFANWFADVTGGASSELYRDSPVITWGMGDSTSRAVISRGFISRITLSWNSWLRVAPVIYWPGKVRCRRCWGSGDVQMGSADYEYPKIDCPACHGTGEVEPTMECPQCKGSGEHVTDTGGNVWVSPCSNCGGEIDAKTLSRKMGSGTVPHPFPATACPLTDVTLTTWPGNGDRNTEASLAVLWPRLRFVLPTDARQ